MRHMVGCMMWGIWLRMVICGRGRMISHMMWLSVVHWFVMVGRSMMHWFVMGICWGRVGGSMVWSMGGGVVGHGVVVRHRMGIGRGVRGIRLRMVISWGGGMIGGMMRHNIRGTMMMRHRMFHWRHRFFVHLLHHLFVHIVVHHHSVHIVHMRHFVHMRHIIHRGFMGSSGYIMWMITHVFDIRMVGIVIRIIRVICYNHNGQKGADNQVASNLHGVLS